MARLTVVSLVAANLLIPVAVLIFATGFFPYKPFLPGLAQYEKNTGDEIPPEAPFDRLIFMLVDALRSDFVYSEGSGFEFTQSLIRDGSAMPFTANARSPTITMPRIKSITTGSIPSFLDVILNFDEADTSSSLAAQDTWLAQMKAKGTGKQLMFGDDTWLKLFPATFDRQDGTTSFFVSDFTEVDNNVTRNVAPELKNDDWNTMVLHYLGLDHIGHKSGPRSSNMVPKQREMDGVVKVLYKAIEQSPHLSSTLLVLCGDHGMNDAGNHGASSAGETSPALVFMSPKFKSISKSLDSPVVAKEDFQYYSIVEQSDIAPTLASLLGFPIPKNNLGAVIPSFLPLWHNERDIVSILMMNVKQMLGIVTAAFGTAFLDEASLGTPACQNPVNDAQKLSCGWLEINSKASKILNGDKSLTPGWESEVSEWLRTSQDVMSSMASNYDMSRLLAGVAIALAASLLATAVVVTSKPHLESFKSLSFLIVVTISYGIMMFASSYVEEEQHFWYWASSAWVAYLTCMRLRRNRITAVAWMGAALIATRLVRGWNQTGQKFAGSPDIVKTFISNNPSLLWALAGLCLFGIQFQLARKTSSHGGLALMTVPLVALLTVLAISFKLAFTEEDSPELVMGWAKDVLHWVPKFTLVKSARLVFTGTAMFAATSLQRSISGHLPASVAAEILHYLISLLAFTQSRAANIPLLLLLSVQFEFLRTWNLSITEIATSSLLFQYMSFFAYGGSNSIASIDLSNAYNGVDGFNVVVVGILTFFSNWVGPVFWVSATNLLLLRLRTPSAFLYHAALVTLFTTYSAVFVMTACTVLRSHLFIWTVFSPKYLYCMAWTIGQHLLVNIGLGGLLYWIGGGN